MSSFAHPPEDRYFEDYIPGAVHEFGSITQPRERGASLKWRRHPSMQLKVIFALFAADGLKKFWQGTSTADRRPVRGRIDWLRYERFAPRLRINTNFGIRVQQNVESVAA